jgi:hypothetical protein
VTAIGSETTKPLGGNWSCYDFGYTPRGFVVAYTALLPVDRAACEWFARRLAAHRRTIGTRKGTRRFTSWSQAVLVLRFRIDGTLIPTCRVQVEGPTKGVDLFWSGKHHRHGVNLQVISAPDGYPL